MPRMVTQIEFWNGEVAERWVSDQERLDRVFGPLGDEAMKAARPAPGERVLDVGCGCGGTTFDLARAAGKTGHVLGVDISAPMVARARERAAAEGFGNVAFAEADAATLTAPQPFDLLFSRLGVMFFEDPRLAFTNLARALRPGGRVAFVCWRALDLNDWATVPLAAAVTLVPPPPPAPPGAPGPFAFADAERTLEILRGAGFEDARAAVRDVPLHVGHLEDATDFATRMGPASRLLKTAPPDVQARGREAIREALRPHASKENGVVLRAAQWVVTAARP